jgi:glucosamine--fructose-6-phosphate aminotransferase (isomerizing)
MCGIDAVFGKNAVLKALLITLGQLERGEKGTGVAYIRKERIKVVKEPISPMKFFIEKHYLAYAMSKVAIAHNRNPSQGSVSYENTHPFLSCDKSFVLAHNGTIWNHDEAERMKKLGHKIQGKTDSEILVHELEEYLKESDSFVEALNKLINNNLNGAIVILTKQGEIYATKKGVEPLNYAEVDGDVYVASSPTAIANLITNTKYVIKKVKSKQILRIDKKGNVEVIGKGEDDYEVIPEYFSRYLSRKTTAKTLFLRDPTTGEWRYYNE